MFMYSGFIIVSSKPIRKENRERERERQRETELGVRPVGAGRFC